MSWERIEPPTGASEALGALRTADAWFFRGISSVLACAPGDAEARWETELGDDTMVIGPKLVVSAGGAVVTLVEEEGGTCTVLALDPAKGTRRWRTKLEVNPGMSGLAVLDDWVLVHGTDAQRSGRLFALAADGGTVRHQVRTETANGVSVAGGRALVPVRLGEGVYAWEPGGELETLYDRETDLAAARGDSLFVRTPDGPAVVELDAKSGEERGRVRVTGEPRELHALPAEGRVLLMTDKVARVLDVRRGKAVCTLALPKGMTPAMAAATPHGVVVAHQAASGLEGAVAVYDPRTGKMTQELTLEGMIPEGIYHAGGQLVVSAGGFIHFFAWKGE